jgi:aryl-alcohol dehydrogenase-like predicted oxidoreductase
VIATKFGSVRGADGSFLGVSGRPEYVKRACEASLKRLGVDEIDLYYQHRVDPDTPIEETIAQWQSWCKRVKFAVSACPKRLHPPYGVPMQFTRSLQ